MADDDALNYYSSYEDWYDNGPGSENFKRKLKQDEIVERKRKQRIMEETE